MIMYISDNKVEYNFTTLNVNSGAGYLEILENFHQRDVWYLIPKRCMVSGQPCNDAILKDSFYFTRFTGLSEY